MSRHPCTTGKVPYPSPQAAHRTLRDLEQRHKAAHLRRRRKDGQEVYHCGDCGMWHLRSKGLRR